MTSPGIRVQSIDAVVIGASAGGVEALSVLLPVLPGDLIPPVFIVLHVPRDRPSLLIDIFRSKCARPVLEAEDKQPIEPGTVYFAPPDYHLLIEADRRIALSADQPVHHSRPSIDVLFQSAIDVYGRRLLGVLLTGANEDGGDGALAIRHGGGITVVQEPETAASPVMPASALKRFAPTCILPIAAIADLLGGLGSRSPVKRQAR
jgi:two-component system, chemotaxis family, protein-glutamate methylesterase/glutaminase